MKPPTNSRLSAEKRFWVKVTKTDTCWLWTARKIYSGYGQFQIQGRKIYAHRFSYELQVGPVPHGLVLDHLCRVRHCVNPAHLEPVTQGVNLIRGDTITARNAAKTMCDHGHEYTPANTCVRRDGRRYCRACDRERQRARYARKAKGR